jgi:branched-chain amino acid transport system ATP-binding protein
MLEVNQIAVNYGNVTGIKDISFNVYKNQIVSLVGSNGAGKTTTLMAVSGLRQKSKGQINFYGENITNMTADMIVRRGICHVPEGRHIFSNLSVEDNLIMGAVCRPQKRAKIKEKLDRQYELFPRLKDRRGQSGATLSGGEQQMLAIGRALMGEPVLLMLDEPSMGLSPIVIDEIYALISELKKSGWTILLVEQNANMALSISDYAYVFDLGGITMSGTGQELLKNDMIQKAYLGEWE